MMYTGHLPSMPKRGFRKKEIGATCAGSRLALTQVSFLRSKVFSWIILSILFRAINHQIVDKSNSTEFAF